jgi:hypothetical protein
MTLAATSWAEGPKTAIRGGEWEPKKLSRNIWLLSQIHRQTHEPTNMMSMTQKNGWMFPRNTAGHHKANAKDGTQDGAQTIKKQTARCSI